MARILAIALLWVAASVPAFVAGVQPVGWCLALLGGALAIRFPMAGFCVQAGGGAFLGLTALSIYDADLLGPPGLWGHDPWMNACAWLTLAEPGALIGFAGPRVIATTLKQELPAGFQRAEFLLEKGQIDRIVKRGEMKQVLARLLDYTQGPKVASGKQAKA